MIARLDRNDLLSATGAEQTCPAMKTPPFKHKKSCQTNEYVHRQLSKKVTLRLARNGRVNLQDEF